MLVFSDGNSQLKFSRLVTPLPAHSAASGVGYGSPFAITPGTGGLFFDFQNPPAKLPISDYYEQAFTIFDDAGNYEIAYITNRTGDNLTISRRRPGNVDVPFQAWPAGTKIAPFLNASLMHNLVQKNNAAIHLGYNYDDIVFDTGINPSELKTAIGWGARTWKDRGTALGPDSRANVRLGFSFGGWPVLAKDADHRGMEHSTAGMEGCFTTICMDLAGGMPYQVNHTYKHGDVVKPTTPNGLQYYIWADWWKYDQTTCVSGPTEPVWPTTDWEYVDLSDGDPPITYGYAVSVDLQGNGFDIYMDRGMTFYPTKFVWICDNLVNKTVDPVVSIGVTGDEGRYLNNVTVNGITASKQIKVFTPASNAGITFQGPSDVPLKIKLNTPAVADRFHGRWIVQGYFVEDLNNPPVSYLSI